MNKLLLLLMALGLLMAFGCGEAQEEPAADVDEEVVEDPVEEVEIVEIAPAADPGNLTDFRGMDGEELFFWVTGDTWGSVWGTDIYTDDSNLAAAAVHCGVLAEGETGVVMVTILPGEMEYIGSESNGIESYDYGEWEGSYIVEALPDNYEIAAMPAPANMVDYRGQDGETFEFLVTGDTWGSVWGTDIYSDDSNIATAAVHAGVLEDGETGVVTIVVLPGEESYVGSERNGITTWDYGSWTGSYSFE